MRQLRGDALTQKFFSLGNLRIPLFELLRCEELNNPFSEATACRFVNLSWGASKGPQAPLMLGPARRSRSGARHALGITWNHSWMDRNYRNYWM